MEIQNSSYYKCENRSLYLNSLQSNIDRIAIALEKSKSLCLLIAKEQVSEKFLVDVIEELESKGFEVSAERFNEYTPTYLLAIFIQ